MFADLKYAVRQLIKSPGFTVVALITLALGVGVNTSMFTLLNAVTLSESSAYDSARLVSIFRTSPQSQSWPHSPADLRDLERQSSSFRTTAGFTYSNVNLAEPGQPAERLHGMAVSSEFFPLFGVSPALGRTFTAEEDRAGAGRVAVISDGLWRTRFAADPGVVGRTVRMDAQPTTIIGVMPGRFADPLYWGHVDLWVPLAYDSATWQVRDNHWLSAIGRLKDGVSLAQAQAEGSAIATRLEHEHPDTNAQSGIRLAFWNDVRIADVSRRITWLCMGLSGFVLLIACANLANLQLARAAAKAHEHALRVALGASRLRLMRQFLVESLLLSLAGGALGVLVASWGTRLMGAQIVIGDVPGLDLPVNMRVLAFSLVVAVATGIGFGTVPAWIASRADLGLALKQSGRGATGGRSRHRIRQALIVSELVLALVLMSGAAFFVRGMQRISRSDMGWRPEHLVIAGLTLPFNPSYATDEQCRAFYDRLEAKLSELPGVESAAVSATLPITGFWSSSNFAVEGRPPPQKGREPLAYFNPASPGYFKTLGIRIVKGRDFNATDRASSRAVVVINEAMAGKLWPGEDAVGKRIGSLDPAAPNWAEVIGVVADLRPLIEIVRPADTPFQAYRPLAQTPSHEAHYLSISVRTSEPFSTLAPALRQAVASIDPDQPVFSLYTAEEGIRQFTSSFDLVSQILGIFAILGLVLSAVGLYGVIANLVAQRTSEIGVRMALGAQVADVLFLVLKQGMVLAVVGTAVGLLCSWGLVRLLEAAVPAIPGSDPVALVLITVILMVVALLASWIPARKATQVDPLTALRTE